jgi:hypothetical protein
VLALCGGGFHGGGGSAADPIQPPDDVSGITVGLCQVTLYEGGIGHIMHRRPAESPQLAMTFCGHLDGAAGDGSMKHRGEGRKAEQASWRRPCSSAAARVSAP